MKALSLLVLVACAACAEAPGQPSAVTVQESAPLATTSQEAGVTVSGPRGCVEVGSLPAVVVWTIDGLPDGAELAKGYHWDDSPGCTATEQHQRTQNSHLRIIPTGPTSVRVEFDRDTVMCTGRQQVDVSLDGRVLIGMVINRPKGKDCKAKPPEQPPVSSPVPSPPVVPLPAPPPLPNPPSSPPVPSSPAPLPDPPKPVPPKPCEQLHPPAFDRPTFTRTNPAQDIEAKARVHHGAAWTFTIYASHSQPGHAPFKKSASEVTLRCGEHETLVVSYPWTLHPSEDWWVTLRKNGAVVFTSQAVKK